MALENPQPPVLKLSLLLAFLCTPTLSRSWARFRANAFILTLPPAFQDGRGWCRSLAQWQTPGASCASGCDWKWLTGGHLVCTSKSTSESMREGSRTPAMVWKPGTCSCSWIWSLRRRISRRCISMILPVSSCSFSLIVELVPTMSLLATVRDKAGSLQPVY